MNSLFATLTLAAAAAVPAQPPMPVPAPPQPAAPLVFAKVMGPAGMKVTFHPGTTGAKTFTAPALVGFRPGYVYRLELSLPQYSSFKLYPTLEVRGALQLGLAQAMRHPVPIVFLDDEIRRVEKNGSMITKVHYLEDPSQAPPIATTPDDPLVVDVPNEVDPVDEGRSRGRLITIVRLGEKEPSKEELVRFAVPNTIWFPGDARVTLPTAPPQVPWLHWPVFDPIAGARRGNEECLPDGGDVGPRIGIAPDGNLGGFNASETAMLYTTENGKRKVAVSNRVCIIVPRFAIARHELAPMGSKLITGTGVSRSGKAASVAAQQQRTTGHESATHLGMAQSKTSASGMQSRFKLHTFENLRGVSIIGSMNGAKVVGAVKGPDEITAYPFAEPISLFKWSDPKEAQVGDTVTFYLRYHNHTKQFVENIVISDSLTARFEYVPASARSDRESALSVQPNEAGSVILRWEIAGKLAPGESGIVAFQVKVR